MHGSPPDSGHDLSLAEKPVHGIGADNDLSQSGMFSLPRRRPLVTVSNVSAERRQQNTQRHRKQEHRFKREKASGVDPIPRRANDDIVAAGKRGIT
jgi:hypothetical protein